MGSPVRLGDLERKLRKFGAFVESGSKHKKAIRDIGKRRLIYPFPTESGRKVKDLYIPKIRKKLELTPEDGISDEDWNDA